MDAGCTHRFMRVVKLFMLFAICGQGTGDGETGYGRCRGQPLAARARLLSCMRLRIYKRRTIARFRTVGMERPQGAWPHGSFLCPVDPTLPLAACQAQAHPAPVTASATILTASLSSWRTNPTSTSAPWACSLSVRWLSLWTPPMLIPFRRD